MEKKLSPDLDEATLAYIMKKKRVQDSDTVQANCSICSAPIDGTYYDIAVDSPRICTVCKITGMKKKWKDPTDE